MGYNRICKYCKKSFTSNKKHSKVCKDCREKNHRKKIERTLFNGNEIEYY
jgi:hypothetical protein